MKTEGDGLERGVGLAREWSRSGGEYAGTRHAQCGNIIMKAILMHNDVLI